MLSEALRLIRVYHDLKQTELAKELGISVSYLSEIERGKKTASLEIIENYARIFKISASSILFFSENMNTEFSSSEKALKARGVIANKVLNFLALIETKTELENAKKK